MRPALLRATLKLNIVLRGGAGPRGFLATLSQYMLSSAATFSFFLAIGSVSSDVSRLISVLIVLQVIRSDSLVPPHLQAAHMQLMAARPDIRSRMEGAQLVRARWDAEKRRLSSQKQS